MEGRHWDIIVIGSGLGSLTSAALLAKTGRKVLVLEQNYLPGGCTSSYWRKGFVFEAGATTLVGLDEYMPLKFLLDEIQVEIPAKQLQLPMEVRLSDNRNIKKYQDLDQWIKEAELVFGEKNQRAFWKKCYEISEFVWQTSLQQKHFPPTSISDFSGLIKGFQFSQLKYGRYALITMEQLLKKYGLHNNEQFVKYVNEQLLITAQNHMDQVNVLFGAAALCYTNYSNYYVNGGLINLVNPIIDYIKEKDGDLLLKEPVLKVQKGKSGYLVDTKNGSYTSEFLVSGLPINNTIQLYDNGYSKNFKNKLLKSKHLNSAFQMGIGFKPHRNFEAIHHQIHLDKPLKGTGSQSIFLSLNHDADDTRCDIPGTRVASISSHIPDPEITIFDKKETEEEVLRVLDEKGYIKRDNIHYMHSSTQKSWAKWTGREFGFVGGYPQFKNIKPWQMKDARLDGHKAYICGDTTYPGQGIPGVTLSGIIAFEKLRQDWF